MARRAYYIAARAAMPPPPVPVDEPALTLRGAKAIAEHIGIPVKAFYKLRAGDASKGQLAVRMPVREVPGVGLCADGPTLLSWWRSYLREGAT